MWFPVGVLLSGARSAALIRGNGFRGEEDLTLFSQTKREYILLAWVLQERFFLPALDRRAYAHRHPEMPRLLDTFRHVPDTEPSASIQNQATYLNRS